MWFSFWLIRDVTIAPARISGRNPATRKLDCAVHPNRQKLRSDTRPSVVYQEAAIMHSAAAASAIIPAASGSVPARAIWVPAAITFGARTSSHKAGIKISQFKTRLRP